MWSQMQTTKSCAPETNLMLFGEHLHLTSMFLEVFFVCLDPTLCSVKQKVYDHQVLVQTKPLSLGRKCLFLHLHSSIPSTIVIVSCASAKNTYFQKDKQDRGKQHNTALLTLSRAVASPRFLLSPNAIVRRDRAKNCTTTMHLDRTTANLNWTRKLTVAKAEISVSNILVFDFFLS